MLCTDGKENHSNHFEQSSIGPTISSIGGVLCKTLSVQALFAIMESSPPTKEPDVSTQTPRKANHENKPEGHYKLFADKDTAGVSPTIP